MISDRARWVLFSLLIVFFSLLCLDVIRLMMSLHIVFMTVSFRDWFNLFCYVAGADVSEW